MVKILKQLTTTDKFIEEQPLQTTKSLLSNNEGYKDLVYTIIGTNEAILQQPKAKAYYVKAKMPYNEKIPTAFIFKIRDTESGVEDSSILDFENDTHQVLKYAETPYGGEENFQFINVLTVGYTVQESGNNPVRLYHTYTYSQLRSSINSSFSLDDFNNINNNTNLQSQIKNYIINGGDSNNFSNFKYNLQRLDTSNLNGENNYIEFDFIFVSKITWNQFICCYDRNKHDEYLMGGRVLDENDLEMFVEIYPFISNSDLIERSTDFGANRIFHNSFGEINKLTLKVYNGNGTALSDIPFYINGQSIKIGPSKQYTIENVPIYNFGIPNENENTCIIEYEYTDD